LPCNSEYIPTKTKSYIIHRFDNVVIKDPPILQNEFQLNTQQQQQHSILSQVSWGRLEMKPKRDEKQGDTKRDIKGTRQKEVTAQAR
jgi:signal peptidase I